MMNYKLILCSTCFAFSSLTGIVSATPATPVTKATPAEAPNPIDSPTTPKFNTQPWSPPRYAVIKKSLLENPCDILFVGDSITEQWEFVGKKVWDELFIPRRAVNFGVSGDRTESVLWRMQDTKLATTTPPKVCIVTIGTNNIGEWKGKQSAKEMVTGVKKIATELLNKFPKTRLIIMATFPYGPDPKAEYRILGEQLDAEIAKIKLPRTKVLNINKHFLNTDGTFKEGIFKDKVHLTEKGYQVWADQILPIIDKVLDTKKGGR
ncbi:MAG: GDSL-type esterase/lipase family protein [Akkermansia sp.]